MFKLVIKITDMNDLVATSAFSLTTSGFIFCLPEYVVCLNAVHITVLKKAFVVEAFCFVLIFREEKFYIVQ